MPLNLGNSTVLIPSSGRRVGTGWIPPTVDPRDFTDGHDEIAPITDALAQKLKANKKSKLLSAPPPSVDLRQWCSPIENQGGLGSCTANAAMGVVEYFERRSCGRHIDGSRRFVYKTTRNLIGVTGDTGAWLRNAMGALTLCGVPNERYWPYTDVDPDFDIEPPQFVYAVADNFEALKYFAHDPLGSNVARQDVLDSVRKYLAAGVPSMFGFFGYPSFDSGDAAGYAPFPTKEELAGDPAFGHAVVAVGYDDGRKIKNTVNSKSTTGALLFRNSWGTAWGDMGYGWMPYDYLLAGIALDFWSLIKMEWVNSDRFLG